GGPKPARRADGSLTIGPVAASKYSERSARHQHCRHRHVNGSPRCLRTRVETVEMGTGACRHSTGNRPSAGTWRHTTRTRDRQLMAAEKRPTASHRGTDVDHLSIEEKYDEVRQLINIGKEKGYLLYDEVNELLPSEITSSDELDDLFNTFGSAGIEVIDSDQKYLRDDKVIDRTGEGAEELELDLTPGALDKTNDPVRMYLREMGTVPLLTREGEVEIAKRIERGKLAVIKSISRTPTIARAIIELGDQLHSGDRTIRELVIFNDEEITDERIQERSKQVQKKLDACGKEPAR